MPSQYAVEQIVKARRYVSTVNTIVKQNVLRKK